MLRRSAVWAQRSSAAPGSALSPGTAPGQTTGADPIEKEAPPSAARQEREDPETSEKPGKIKVVLGYIKDHRLVERFTSGDGFYPRFGGLPTGAGFTAGIGFRKRLVNQHALFRVSALLSTHGYAGFEAEQWFEQLGRLGGFAGVELTASPAAGGLLRAGAAFQPPRSDELSSRYRHDHRDCRREAGELAAHRDTTWIHIR